MTKSRQFGLGHRTPANWVATFGETRWSPSFADITEFVEVRVDEASKIWGEMRTACVEKNIDTQQEEGRRPFSAVYGDFFGGGWGIRTPEGFHPTRFPSVRHRPLGESSVAMEGFTRPTRTPS